MGLLITYYCVDLEENAERPILSTEPVEDDGSIAGLRAVLGPINPVNYTPAAIISTMCYVPEKMLEFAALPIDAPVLIQSGLHL